MSIKQKLAQRLENQMEEQGDKARGLTRLQQMAVVGLTAGASSSAFALESRTGTGEGFLQAMVEFAHSPFMIGIAIVAVILGVMFAIGGNIKAAFMPFGLAALISLGPWLVNEIFEVFEEID